MQASISSGCRNASALWGGMGYSLFCLRYSDPTSLPSETSTQLLLGRGTMTHLAVHADNGAMGDRGEGTCLKGQPMWSLRAPNRTGWRAYP
jgi:hypothetical protein